MFWRQLKFAEFDVSEMSVSSLVIATSNGPTEWVAIPVFTMRHFFHTSVLVRKAAGIEKPSDLRGKRIGVPEYQQTWAVWSRGIFADEFGVQPQRQHLVHGAHARKEPRRRDRLHAAAGRRVPLHPAVDEHGRDDGQRRARRDACSTSRTAT